MIHPLLLRGPRYLAVTLFCFVFNNVLLLALSRMGLHYVWCVLISIAVMIPLSYWLHARYTFGTSCEHTTFVRFAAAQALNIPVSLVLFYLLRDRLNLSMNIAVPLSTSVMFAWNFVAAWWALQASQRTSR